MSEPIVTSVTAATAPVQVPPPERQTISALHACRLVQVSRHTLFNWIAEGRVEFTRNEAGAIRLYVDTLPPLGGRS